MPALVEEAAVTFDMRRQIQRVLASQFLCQLGIASLQRLDDVEMIDD